MGARRRSDDKPDMNFNKLRGVDIGGWLRYALGGLVAGLVAWGGIQNKVGQLELRLQMADDRAVEDRGLLRSTINELRGEIRNLSDGLHTEREQRLRDATEEYRRTGHISRTPVFPRDSGQFDK